MLLNPDRRYKLSHCLGKPNQNHAHKVAATEPRDLIVQQHGAHPRAGTPVDWIDGFVMGALNEGLYEPCKDEMFSAMNA
ncbi:hypothetical protein VNO77_20032 [Canavalia gladiata]|uniref:Uncharacterized protein n=1 Tax=Canavalia gladiata TaxID=3824 RepID=A0AAN9LS17_CANGL